MKKFIKLIFSSVLALSVAVFSGVVYYDATLSDSYYVAKGTSLTLSGNSVLQCKPNGSSLTVGKSNSASVGAHETTVSLFGLFPIKTVSVTASQVASQSASVGVSGNGSTTPADAQSQVVSSVTNAVDTDDALKNVDQGDSTANSGTDDWENW